MFDFGKFIGWISGGLLDSHPTWETYRDENHSWQNTAMQLSAPLVVAFGLLTLLLGGGGGFMGFIFMLVMSFIWFGVGSFIASFLAGKFGGEDNFNQAWAALTFASIPGIIGGLLGVLPWVGFLFAIAGAIWTLMLLWQSLPVFLQIPLDRRTGHFFSTLGLGIVTMFICSVVLGAIGLAPATSDFGVDDYYEESRNRVSLDNSDGNDRADRENRGNGGGTTVGGSDNDGSFLGLGRELDYLEEAGNDTYTPPADGKLTSEQVVRTVKALAAAQRLRDASTKRLEKLGDDNAEPSFGDFMKGMKGLVSAGSAEMQAVKGGGGNWAEHEWVKRQLFEAQIQQDSNATTAHNYELYQEYAEELDGWL